MAINKKLIHFKTKANFVEQYEAGNILNTSIVFIQDAKEIWTHGTYYPCPVSREELTTLLDSIVDAIETESTERTQAIEELSQQILSKVDNSYLEEILYGSAHVGDIVLVEKSNPNNKIFVNPNDVSEYSVEEYEPIGIVVIPSSHNIYENGECGIMALKYGSILTPDTGAFENTTEDKPSWGSYDIDYKELINFDTVVGIGVTSSAPNNAIGAITENRTQGYLPILNSEQDTNYNCPYDPDTKYLNVNYTNVSYIPSPYLEDDSRNNIYYRNTSGTNALSDFAGKSNTEFLCSKITEQPNWKTDEALLRDDGSYSTNAQGYHSAAACCWRYHTIGTSQGDWYLPACGELGYICPKYEIINKSLLLIQEQFNIEKSQLLIDFPQFLTSTELNYRFCRAINISTGNVGTDYKNSRAKTLPFLRLKPNGIYQKLDKKADKEDLNNVEQKLQDLKDDIYVEPTIEMVDLGLPSGTLWAKTNLKTSEGEYFQWGDPNPISNITLSALTEEITLPYKFTNSDGSGYTKYNESDGLHNLQPEDDPATVILGPNYHTPSEKELSELFLYTNISVVFRNGETFYQNPNFDSNNLNTENINYFINSDGVSLYQYILQDRSINSIEEANGFVIDYYKLTSKSDPENYIQISGIYDILSRTEIPTDISLDEYYTTLQYVHLYSIYCILQSSDIYLTDKDFEYSQEVVMSLYYTYLCPINFLRETPTKILPVSNNPSGYKFYTKKEVDDKLKNISSQQQEEFIFDVTLLEGDSSDYKQDCTINITKDQVQKIRESSNPNIRLRIDGVTAQAQVIDNGEDQLLIYSDLSVIQQLFDTPGYASIMLNIQTSNDQLSISGTFSKLYLNETDSRVLYLYPQSLNDGETCTIDQCTFDRIEEGYYQYVSFPQILNKARLPISSVSYTSSELTISINIVSNEEHSSDCYYSEILIKINSSETSGYTATIAKSELNTPLRLTSGDGTKFLSDDGTYKSVEGSDLTELSTAVETLKQRSDTLEIVIDKAYYSDIIAEDGLINKLSSYQCTTNLTRTKCKECIGNIKFIALKNSDSTNCTYLNVVFTMPELGLFCGYGFNKLNGQQLGIGYATCSWKDETTLRITSVRSTMYIDGYAPEVESGKQSDWNVTDSSDMAYIKNKPTIPTVYSWAQATSKPTYAWSEISSKPSWIGSSKPTYAWSEISSKPTFATVATSGSYNDLSNKPTIPSVLSGVQTSFTSWTTIPVDKKLIVGTFSADTTLKLNGTIPSGENITLIIKNSSTANRTLNLTNFTIRNVDTITVAASAYAEINIAYDGSSTYIRGINYED